MSPELSGMILVGTCHYCRPRHEDVSSYHLMRMEGRSILSIWVYASLANEASQYLRLYAGWLPVPASAFLLALIPMIPPCGERKLSQSKPFPLDLYILSGPPSQ